jgi:FkbM family methyltransferase
VKYLSLFFKKTGALSKRFFDKIARVLYRPIPSIKDEGANEFYKSGGEQLRFDYPGLKKNSIVFDLGGYEGQWASDIYGRYRPKIYIFEVYAPYYDNIKERFFYNDAIKVYNFGLSAQDAVTQIAIDGYSTSAFKKSENMVEIELKNISHFILENKIKKIDLMKINIEGAEYGLLAHLISTGIVKIIANLQIQFHDFIPDAFNEMNSIREKLSITHFPTYKFDFTWDNWKLKE